MSGAPRRSAERSDNSDEQGRILALRRPPPGTRATDADSPGKLATNVELRATVQARLDTQWSPKQIAQHLGIDYPNDWHMRVSHETIYQALYAKKGH